MTKDHDWIAYLTGQWHLHREITDHRQQQTGRLIGTARFIVSGDHAMDWQENGRLIMGDHNGEAWQRYRLCRTANGDTQILFPDGRRFFDLPAGQTTLTMHHNCAPDRYDGMVSVQDIDHWQLQWRVQGPRKDYAMVSHYKRV